MGKKFLSPKQVKLILDLSAECGAGHTEEEVQNFTSLFASSVIDSLFLQVKQVRAARFEEVKAAKKAALEGVQGITEGRYEVVGKVAGTKWVYGDYGDSLKVRFEDEAGNGYWCSLPKGVGRDVEKGALVAITASWTCAPGDTHFAFGKRPTGRLFQESEAA
jgi:hypothetical protein